MDSDDGAPAYAYLIVLLIFFGVPALAATVRVYGFDALPFL